MSSFLDRLIAADAEWHAHARDTQEPLPECLALYREYIATGKYPYHAQVTKFMMEKIKVNEEKMLHTQSYLSAACVRREAEASRYALLEADGWIRSTLDCPYAGPKTGLVSIRFMNDGMLGEKEQIIERCRVVEDEGQAFFLPPRNSRRGFHVGMLVMRKGMYKILA